MHKKNEQLLAYIIKNRPGTSVTSLMKLSYLVDLVSIKKGQHQISDFKYRRYYYGPFDNKIYNAIEGLVENNVIEGQPDYSFNGDEYIIYSFTGEENTSFDLITDDEEDIILEVLESIKGYGAKTLMEITYKTKPMIEIGATIGGREHLNEILDLESK